MNLKILMLSNNNLPVLELRTHGMGTACAQLRLASFAPQRFIHAVA